MKNPRVIFFGATTYSEKLLRAILEVDIVPEAIFYIPEHFSISYSQKPVTNYNYSNLEKIARDLEIPHYIVNGSLGQRISDYEEIIECVKPDIILVLGWYYMVPRRIRDKAKYGAWGIHASLLPKYAGGAPLNWAIIKGEKETGVTLFKLDDGVDDGDIISQEAFSIEDSDTIKDVYEKATVSSIQILKNSLSNFRNVKFTKQDKSKIEVFPQRRPEDGEIDLTKKGQALYNFIRAQSAPYPGAFIKTVDGKKLIIEKARLED